MRRSLRALGTCAALAVLGPSCDGTDVTAPSDTDTYVIPVVVHVVHLGEPIGQGHNLSRERIVDQIRRLNDDYRRRPGTAGYNEHPAGGDAGIEFVLARVDPSGAPTDGIVRIDATRVHNPVPPNQLFDYYAGYSYWNPEHYMNVWTMPLPESSVDVVLGQATGPVTDLPGAELLLPGEPHQAEGILINSAHFGASAVASDYNLGRTLTHEVGHYLGLLHLWGAGDCAENDHCDDTPAVSTPVAGCPAQAPIGCNGQPVMIANYMTYTHDRCMNMFTRDQIARMRHVLEHSPRRRTLPGSPGLGPT